jgi:hypothetical protein
MDFSMRNGMDVPDDMNNSCFNAIQHILKEAHISRVVSVKCSGHSTGSAFCFAVAHNQTIEGLEGATKERIVRLQKALGGREDPPKWLVLN